MRTSKGYSQLAIARESAPIACLWQRPRGRQERGKAVQWRRKGFRCALISLLAPGSWRQAN